MIGELNYELRSDGVLYNLPDGTCVKVQGNSLRRATISLQKGTAVVPPETGNLGSSTLRNMLVNLAGERFEEVNGLADDLGSIAAMFENHLEEREVAAAEHDRENNIPEFVGTPYHISERSEFLRLKYANGTQVPVTLTNFVARVEEEIIKDDGVETKRVFKISGRIGDRPLPQINVPGSQFHSMSWVMDHWGIEAHIMANQNSYAKEAIELYSRDAVKSFRFAHTGWRVLEDGTRVYLHSKGAIS